jgi:hypothetical protein
MYQKKIFDLGSGEPNWKSDDSKSAARNLSLKSICYNTASCTVKFLYFSQGTNVPPQRSPSAEGKAFLLTDNTLGSQHQAWDRSNASREWRRNSSAQAYCGLIDVTHASNSVNPVSGVIFVPQHHYPGKHSAGNYCIGTRAVSPRVSRP